MEVVKHWRLRNQRYSLVGEECPHCANKMFPPRDICPECGGGTLNGNLETKVRNGAGGKGESRAAHLRQGFGG